MSFTVLRCKFEKYHQINCLRLDTAKASSPGGNNRIFHGGPLCTGGRGARQDPVSKRCSQTPASPQTALKAH